MLLSKKRMCRSSCAVMLTGSKGWLRTRLILQGSSVGEVGGSGTGWGTEWVGVCVDRCVYGGREGDSDLFCCWPLIGRRLPAVPAESSLSSSCCVSMLKRPTWPLWKDATIWAESLLTRSTEVGTPSSERHTHNQSIKYWFKDIYLLTNTYKDRWSHLRPG